MLFQTLIFTLGIVFLYIGGMVFIRGSSDTAYIFNIRPVIIGVVVVAFATSAPEFCVSLLASIDKKQSLSIGNIIGSCICNIGLVLGLSAIVRPVKIEGLMLRREIPVLLAATLLLFVLSLDLLISRIESILLLICFSAFVIYCIKNAKMASRDVFKKSFERKSRALAFIFLISGLAGLLSGAYMVVNSAVILARNFGVSELVVGLTVVAIGTSLPELFASISAASQSEGDISIGNVVGSNIFNIFAILGVAGLISPIVIESRILYLSLPVLLIYTILLVPIIKTGYTISRREGSFLFLTYFFYLWGVLKI
jgi:cation:H+ antiporter